MAHDLYKIEDGWSMAFTGMPCWHGLGQPVTPDASLKIWAEEARLTWKVLVADVNYEPFKDDKRFFDGRKVLYRSDTGDPLSVVSDRYKPVQPEEILDFFRSLIKSHGFKMNTAGSLKGGQRIWALAETGKGGSIMGQDHIGCYLLLATSCDGSLSTTAAFTTIRVVCNNTLSLAYSLMKQGEDEAKTLVKVPHNAIFNPDDVKLELGLTDELFDKFLDDASDLASIKVTKEQSVEYFMDLLTKKEGDYSDIPERTMKGLYKVYEGGVGQDLKSTHHTAWGLVNAVSRFTDHERQSTSQDTRLNSAWFGNSNRLKNRAMNLALSTFRKAA